jgi:MFS family permease
MACRTPRVGQDCDVSDDFGRGGTDSAQRALEAAKSTAASMARVSSGAAKGTVRRIRRATHAGGAGESGLAKVIELQAINAAGDTLIAVSLAGTLFFDVPLGEARGKVVLYLLITMAPFAIVAPVVGPLLDRMRHGRRWALATAMLARAFLAWVMADAVTGGLALYPAAFGALVASKAHGVLRGALVPRMLPPSTTLVRANARVSMAGTIAMLVAGPIGAALAWIGPQWSLRAAFVVFAIGMVLALKLPHRVDVPAGGGEEEEPERTAIGEIVGKPRGVTGGVVMALRANAAFRAFSGFLIIYLAFLLKSQPLEGLSTAAMYALVAAAAAIGSFLGTALGSRLPARSPEPVIMLLMILETVALAVSALWYGVVSVVGLAAVAGFGQSLGKLALDALLQRDVDERIRASVFARVETLLQLTWVLGGFAGIVLTLWRGAGGDLGFGAAAILMFLTLVYVIRGLARSRRSRSAADSPLEAAVVPGSQVR